MKTESTNYFTEFDFDHLAYFAYKRYIEGVQTIELMEQANSDREKEEIALVALLDVQADMSIVLSHHQPHEDGGHLSDFRQLLQQHIQVEKIK